MFVGFGVFVGFGFDVFVGFGLSVGFVVFVGFGVFVGVAPLWVISIYQTLLPSVNVTLPLRGLVLVFS